MALNITPYLLPALTCSQTLELNALDKEIESFPSLGPQELKKHLILF